MLKEWRMIDWQGSCINWKCKELDVEEGLLGLDRWCEKGVVYKDLYIQEAKECVQDR